MAGNFLVAAGFFYLLGTGCLLVAGAHMQAWEAGEEDDEQQPWGFNQVVDTSVCDGGEPDWEEY